MIRIRHYFATGLLVTLPVLFTLYLLFITFRFIDGICGKFLNYYLKKHIGFAVPGLGIILGVVIVLIVGFIATSFIGRKVFKALEAWFLKFPFIRQIYPAARQVVDSFISKDSPAFKKVVLVEYPSRGIWSIGFITNDSFEEAQRITACELLHVFVATTPSPLTGFLILVPRENVKVLDISIEEGIKLIVSGGIIKP